MNPDQNQYSIDYLNQIAPPEKKPAMNNKMFFLVIGGGLLIAIVVGILALSSGSGGPKEQLQTLSVRLGTLKTISDASQKSIKSGALRNANSNLQISLSNANRDIAEPLKANGITAEGVSEKVKKAENGEALTKKLEDARLNAVFDRIYAREMGFQLDKTITLMKTIHNSTSSKSLKTFLETTSTNLDPIKKQFNDFNSEMN